MKIRILGAATAAVLLALNIAPGTASAAETTESERYSGAAEASTLELSVLGNRILAGAGLASGDVDAVKGAVDGAASGIGHTLDDASMVGAGGAGEGGEHCVRPALPDLGDLHVAVSAVCGRASVSGSGTDLVATGSAALADLSVSADLLSKVFENETIKPILDDALGTLDSLANTGDEAVDTVEEQEQVQEAIDTLNATLSELTGGMVSIPDLDATDTVRGLVERLSTTKLVEVVAGDAVGSVVGNAADMTSTASIAGARVKLLPGLWPDGRALATITISESVAEVSYDRSAATTSGDAHNAIVRIESPVLPEPVEVSVDQQVSLFCDGAVGDLTGIDTPLSDGTLCTEIAVGHPVETQTEDGRLQMSTATVDLTVAKNAANLVDLTGLDIPSVEVPMVGTVGPELVTSTVNDVLGKLGLGGVGAENTGDGALLHMGIASATAQGGGAKVLGETEPVPAPDPGANPGTGDLPRTGGLGALPTLASGLLGTAGALRMALRRRSA